MNPQKIRDFNPWWITPEFRYPEATYKKRFIYDKIYEALKLKLIVSISGLRRVGKTTLLRQISNQLLDTNQTLFYYQFSDIDNNLDTVLQYYFESISKEQPATANTFILLDEVQYVKKWQETLKYYYDQNRNIQFIITGSASLYIHKNTKESLAGRILDFKVEPLSFEEYLYLHLNAEKIDSIDATLSTGDIYNTLLTRYKKLTLFSDKIWQFFINGEFAEIINYNDTDLIKKYLNESIIDKIFSKDIKIFQVEKFEELKLLYKTLLQNSAQVFSLQRISADLQLNRHTIKTYTGVLKKTYLIDTTQNYLRSVRAKEKAYKKTFSTSINLICSQLGISDAKNIPYSDFTGHIIENYVYNQITKTFKNIDDICYLNKNKKEVDFIITAGGNTIPIEVKATKTYDKRDLNHLIAFLTKEKLNAGFLFYGGIPERKTIDGKIVYMLPWL